MIQKMLSLFTIFYGAVSLSMHVEQTPKTFDDSIYIGRMLSMMHLMLCIPMASLAMYFSPCLWCVDDMFNRSHILYDLALMNTTGYFIIESIVMFINWIRFNKIDGGKMMIVHHGFAFVTFYINYRVGHGYHICTLFLLNESSTVFLNGIFFYQKQPNIQIISGIGLIITFFVFRIMMFVKIDSILIYQRDEFQHLSTYYLWYFIGICVTFSMINLFWFYKIIKGFYKVLVKKKNL